MKKMNDKNASRLNQESSVPAEIHSVSPDEAHIESEEVEIEQVPK